MEYYKCPNCQQKSMVENGCLACGFREEKTTTKLIDINRVLAERHMPEALKALNDMDKDLSENIINFIIGMIVSETRIALGLEEASLFLDDDWETPFYDVIKTVYKEYYNNCFFCDPEVEFSGKETEICIICHKKLVEYLEYKYGDKK